MIKVKTMAAARPMRAAHPLLAPASVAMIAQIHPKIAPTAIDVQAPGVHLVPLGRWYGWWRGGPVGASYAERRSPKGGHCCPRPSLVWTRDPPLRKVYHPVAGVGFEPTTYGL